MKRRPASSLPGLTRQSILLRKKMDARVKPAHDGAKILRRREFILALGGAAAAWPIAARGQQKTPTIGFLGPASASAMSAWTAAFVQRLRELGWIEGRSIAIEYGWGDGRADRLSEIAAEFVRLKVDVIVTTGTAVPLLKQATSTIPIVFTIANDPIGGGLVTSLSRPGGNATGLSQLAADLGGKRLELLREVIPGLRRLATLSNVGNAVTASEMTQVWEASRTLGLEVVDLFGRAAEYADKILRGAKPADLPVEQPTKFDLVFNLTTAKVLGLQVPEAYLLRADEVIE
jgi:putative tryptophan/tyrosine transport system substrate-binding protein